MKQKQSFPPFEKGYFATTDGYRLYYERYGNPKGIPAIYLHGGPGSGFRDGDKRFFDPRKFNVLLFDQRGAGRSKPFASLKANTTGKLVQDICRLLDHFSMDKVLVFGGSWGSTLALVFAILHPERVRAMLLRGIFLADKQSIDHYLGGGVEPFFPEAWQRLSSLVPAAHRKDMLSYYLSKMRSKSPAVRKKYLSEWARYEMSILKLEVNEQQIKELLKGHSYRSLALLEAHYIKHRCFLAENFILKNSRRISAIPLSIVHGRYDFVCPPSQAFRLKQKLPEARLTYVCAGHSASEPEIERALLEEMKRFGRLYSRDR